MVQQCVFQFQVSVADPLHAIHAYSQGFHSRSLERDTETTICKPGDGTGVEARNGGKALVRPSKKSLSKNGCG